MRPDEVPCGHLAQLVAPAEAWKVPALQLVQVEAPVELAYRPSAQAAQATAAAAANLPAAQKAQLSELVPNWPGEQGSPAPQAAAPVAAAPFKLHGAHVAAPMFGWYVAAGHSAQAGAPVALE